MTIHYVGSATVNVRYVARRSHVLVLSEVDYAGWKAFVDGHQTRLFAYSPFGVKLFMAVHVPAGRHRVRFEYEPFGI